MRERTDTGPGPSSLTPWRLQSLMVFNLSGADDFASIMRWLTDRTKTLWSDLTGIDPVSDPRVALGWSAQPNVGRRHGSEGRPGNAKSSYARLLDSLGRGGGDFGVVWRLVLPPIERFHPQASLRGSCISETAYDRSYAQLELRIGPDASAADLAATETAMIELIVDGVNHDLPILFANVTDDNEDPNKTALDHAIAGTSMARKSPATYARSYSWVTYLGPALADRMGQPELLRIEYGLFRAEHLGGGLLVQATEHLADHVGESVVKLRHALDPVLEEHQTRTVTRTKHPRTSGLRIVWDDGTVGPLDHGPMERDNRPLSGGQGDHQRRPR